LGPSYRKTLVKFGEIFWIRLPKGSYLKVVVPPLAPGTSACTSRFSKSQVKLRPLASERVLPFAS
jgi:hypothetical protein